MHSNFVVVSQMQDFYIKGFIPPGDLSTVSESEKENTSMILDDQQITSKPSR